MGSKLLLADDSITIQKVVGIIFANEEYDLTVVDSGTAVMAKAQEIRPDIILIDALMPGKSGYEVCEEVRRDPVLKGTPLLLLTGAFEPFDEGKAKSSGADDFISKPFESQHLIDKVKKLIETGRSRVSAQPAAAKPTPPPQPAPAAAPPRPMQAAAPAPPQPVRPAPPQRQEVP
ncbi:MAG TPA: response regulator, partial [Geobacterales bacterium]|nr:response regulator [Geobacterales bacterium]